MKKYTGVWLDHKKAFLVSIIGEKETWTKIESKAEGHIRLSGGSRSSTPYGPQEVSSERKFEERRKHQLKRYYEKIIIAMKDSEKILIFGPGEAKTELKKVIEKKKGLSDRIVGIEPADKMTEKEIKAKVKKYFLK